MRPAPYLSRSKVTPPAASAFEIPRQAILEQLSAADASRVIFVHGPAGFGKTTVMTQLLARYRERGWATSWLTLDDGDNDVTRFLAGFAAAVENMQGAPAVPARQPMRNADLVTWLIDSFTAVHQPQAMFFDDLEALSNPVSISLIARGIEAMPPEACVVIGSRTVPDIGLARLRARGALTEIDAASLRFTTREADDFLIGRRGIKLSGEQLSRLHRSTEGWVTALWLASLALERRSDIDKFLSSFSGSNAAIAAYLAEDVLSALPETLREFMLRCGVMDELDPELCNAVCGRSDSAELLRQLERHHLFVQALDEQSETYRFHGLFRDFLVNQLRRNRPSELPTLHLAASRAYIAADRPIPAIRHALRSTDSEAALSLLNLHVDELLGQGRLRLLAEWMGQLPKADLARHPRLKMIYAWCLAFTRGPGEALALVADVDGADLPEEPAAHLLSLRPMLLAMLDRIEEAHELGTAALPRIPDAHSFPRAMLCQALTQTSIILGSHEDARRYVDEARRAQKDSRGSFALVLAESAEALLDMMRGRLKQATARMRLANQSAGHEGARERTGNALAAIQLAEALYENDACVEAQRLLVVNAPLVQDLGLPDALISAHVILARIADDQGDRDHALQLLSELEVSGHRLSLPRAVASARLERARLCLANGDNAGCLEHLTAADQAYDWAGASKRWFVANDTLTPAITRLRWMIRSGASAKAIPLIREALADAEQMQRTRRALKLRILLAEALHGDSQHKMGLRTLSRALQLAQSEGFIRSFLEEGPTVQALLHELNQEPEAGGESGLIQPGSVERWLRGSAAATPASAAAPAAVALADPLTGKELQVLKLLAQGYSNLAMSERLFVSDSTVRTHLRNINLKLHAENRTQAIAIARKLGLIS